VKAWGIDTAIGFVIGVLITYFTIQNGCSVSIELSKKLGIDCKKQLADVPIDFGGQPATWSLGEALKIIAERTQGRGEARIQVDGRVLEATFATKRVNPPAGPQPALSVVQQLLVSAGASHQVDICFAQRGGGYMVQPILP
jgi:hypothetical protein